jgi:hypothetical protein
MILLFTFLILGTSFKLGYEQGAESGREEGMSWACNQLMLPDEGLDGYLSELNIETKCKDYLKEHEKWINGATYR